MSVSLNVITPQGLEPLQFPTKFRSPSRETLERHGVTIESTIEWPEGGDSLYFRDPDHHCIELKTSDWGGTLLPSAPREGGLI